MNESEVKAFNLKGMANASTILVIIGVILCGIGFSQDSKGFLQSYFFGWIFWMTLALGCFGFVLLHYLARGPWGLSVVRLFEAGGGPAMFTALGIAYLPIALNAGKLYKWVDPIYMTKDPILANKTWYLSLQPWTIRQIVYFIFLIGLSYWIRQASLRDDKGPTPKNTFWTTAVAAVGMVVFFILMTMMYVDWVMSLEAHWFSTIIGVWMLIGGGLAAMALANVWVMRQVHKEPYAGFMNKGLSKDLGNLLFVFSMLWAYTSLSQYLIIWSGNIPEFTMWYYPRSQGIYAVIAVVVIVGQFLIPFVSLLSPRAKAVPKILASLAMMIFAVRFLDMYWIIIPFFREEQAYVTPMDFVAMATMGALFVAIFARSLMGAPLIPVHSAKLKEAYAHA